MSADSRTMRIDISIGVYNQLEEHALTTDVGVIDLIRQILVHWTNDHPLPDA